MGLDLKLSLNFCVVVLPSAVRSDERTRAVLVHDDGQHGFGAVLERADGHRQRLAVQRQRRGKRQPAVLVKLRHGHGIFIAAQQKDFRMTVLVPVGHGDLRNAGEAGKFFRRRERAVGLLQINRELAAFRLGHEQVGAAVAVHVRPQNAALGGVGFVQRQNLELAFLERAGQRLRRLARELRDFRAARGLHDGGEIIRVVAREVVQPERADGLAP